MKRFLYALLVGAMVLCMGSNAYSCHPVTGIGCNDTIVNVPSINTDGTSSEAQNGQFQTQPLTVTNLGLNGGTSTLFQNQAGTGSSSALLGSGASESQLQGQNTSESLSNPVTTHNFDSTTVTAGNSIVPAGPGNAFHGEYQDVNMEIGTLSNAAGTASLAGSTMLVDQCVVVGAVNGSAGAGAANDSHLSYDLVNNGPNSAIQQAGNQDSGFITGAGVGDTVTGAAGANLTATQTGGTAAMNDGAGTSMLGGGASEGSVVANNGSTSDAFSGSIGGQNQTHSYSQTAGLGTDQSQWASGSTSTVNTIDSGSLKTGYGIPGI